MEKQPSGTVTLLFTDIEGSTDLVRELRDRYADVLAAHRQIIREAAERHRGEEIDTQGDAFFFTFGRAREAILAAAEAQRALADYDWPEGKHVRVRMGIHTGEPGRTAAGYHGLGVVRGARISAAAHGGQVLVSDATRSVVADDELPGMAFRDLGEHELKGLEQPQRLWQLVIDGLPSTFPPLRVGSPPAAGEVAPRRRRGRWLVVAGIVAVVGAAAAGLTFALTGSTHVAVVSNSVAVVDPATNRVVGDIRVGQQPGPIDAGPDGVWVLDLADHTVSRLDPATMGQAGVVPLATTPSDLAAGAVGTWVVGPQGTLTRVDPATMQAVPPIRFGGPQQGSPAVAVGFGAVWVVAPGLELIRVDPRTGSRTVVTRAPTPNLDQTAAATGGGFVWAAYAASGRLAQVDPSTLQVVGSATLPDGTNYELAAGSDLWVTVTGPNTLAEINPAGLVLEHETNVGGTPGGLALGAGSVWVADESDGTVLRVDPASGRPARSIRLGGIPRDVTFARGLVWVSVD